VPVRRAFAESSACRASQRVENATTVLLITVGF
jgi:hypothetical protein